MNTIVNLPPSTHTNTVISKEKLYEIGDIPHQIRRCFVNEIEKIVLSAVIAPRTMNISGVTYEEMHIIEIKLKGRDLSPKVLETIDSVIPRPVLFAIIRPNGEIKYAISYKELKSAITNKSKIVQRYETIWGVSPLMIVGNSVKNIYVNLIRQLEPNFNLAKPITEAVLDTKEHEKIQRQIEAINRKIKSELSIAKKQDLARERHTLQKQIKNA